jgi:hypothetical protein
MGKVLAFCVNQRDPRRHDWQPSPLVGMSRCKACGVVGVCTFCYQELGKAIPVGTLAWCCPAHAQIQGASRRGARHE